MKIIISLMFCLLAVASAKSQNILVANRQLLVFSAIKGTKSKPDSIVLQAGKTIKIKDIKITGANAGLFKIISKKPAQSSPENPATIKVIFEPTAEFTGLAKGYLQVNGKDVSVALNGLSTKGLEGENEAPLSEVVSALGYDINVGWKTLANHLKSELQGEELPPALFQKAAGGVVEIIPVARYSPDFLLNFGYYVHTPQGPRQIQAGILAKAGSFPEHQTLFPKISKGQTSFDPGSQSFGFYAISPDHTLYSEDCWNILFHPMRASHAVRIYPVNATSGAVPNTYLVCMEEAANGDYNDYVFLVKNIKPVSLESEF
ncbi:MAG TPA: hypothetical protein VG737_18125, partial [Cyclobacteriaceae bacterium]|nr:hypothetical protein [Cyclobacteriaceae bacterium]